MSKTELFSQLTAKYPKSPYIFTFQTIQRENFLSGIYQTHAYEDEEVPIPGFQKTQSYSSMLSMLEFLNLSGEDTILEIGTGSGYLTAILFQHAKKITTVDRNRKICAFAQSNLLKQFPNDVHKNILMKHENGLHLNKLFEPNTFSKIVFTCKCDLHNFPLEEIIPLLQPEGLLLLPTKNILQLYTKNQKEKPFLLDEKEHEFEFCDLKSGKE